MNTTDIYYSRDLKRTKQPEDSVRRVIIQPVPEQDADKPSWKECCRVAVWLIILALGVVSVVGFILFMNHGAVGSFMGSR